MTALVITHDACWAAISSLWAFIMFLSGTGSLLHGMHIPACGSTTITHPTVAHMIGPGIGTIAARAGPFVFTQGVFFQRSVNFHKNTHFGGDV